MITLIIIKEPSYSNRWKQMQANTELSSPTLVKEGRRDYTSQGDQSHDGGTHIRLYQQITVADIWKHTKQQLRIIFRGFILEFLLMNYKL